jgi:hypothetical protein
MTESGSEPAGFREIISDAIAYWEPRRIAYNLVLTAIIVGRVTLTWPYYRGALTWANFLTLFVLAVVANVCYCTAYLVDVPVQYSTFRSAWRRRRWALWVLGMGLAAMMTFYWTVDEMTV